MIFAARGVLVSLAFFATLYCPLSALVALITWSTNRFGWLGARSADLLFWLRISSFAVSSVVTVFLTFPSFWMMERTSLDEDAGTFVLAGCALLILGAGLFRVRRAQARTKHAVTYWLSKDWLSKEATVCGQADRPASPSGFAPRSLGRPSMLASNGAPAMLLVGIRNPAVMVSDRAKIVLSGAELQVAVRHELGHMRSWDNLKKVFICATPFPGMGSLECAWREAAELEADDAAVANRQEALDLAAALIKLSRSAKPCPEPAFASGLVSGTSSVSLRVKRLLAWRAPRGRAKANRGWVLLVLLFVLSSVASNYGATLALTHRLTEILVP